MATPSPLVCKTARIREELLSGDLDPRLYVVLLAADAFMRWETGIRIRLTSMLWEPDTDEVGGRKPNSKHQINPKSRKGEAVDLNPDYALQRVEWETWRIKLKLFIDDHFTGFDVVIHGTDENRHAHIEVDPRFPSYEVLIRPPVPT